MALVPFCAVKDALKQGILASVYVEQEEINQSLYICTRKSDVSDTHPFISHLKKSILSKS